jgi:hypothetical protein
MRIITHAPQVLQQLERNLLRNVVLLKHITAFPDDTNAYLVESIGGVVPSPIAASALDHVSSKPHWQNSLGEAYWRVTKLAKTIYRRSGWLVALE